MLEEIRDAGSMDESYKVVIQALREGKTREDIKNSSNDPCREFLTVWDSLAVMDSKEDSLITMDIWRLVVPQSSIPHTKALRRVTPSKVQILLARNEGDDSRDNRKL